MKMRSFRKDTGRMGARPGAPAVPAPKMMPSGKMPMAMMNCGGKVKGMAGGGQVRGTGAAIKGKGFNGSIN